MTLKDSRWFIELPRWPTHIFALNFNMEAKICWFEKGNSILHNIIFEDCTHAKIQPPAANGCNRTFDSKGKGDKEILQVTSF